MFDIPHLTEKRDGLGILVAGGEGERQPPKRWFGSEEISMAAPIGASNPNQMD
jgi:hypothetical protein